MLAVAAVAAVAAVLLLALRSNHGSESAGKPALHCVVSSTRKEAPTAGKDNKCGMIIDPMLWRGRPPTKSFFPLPCVRRSTAVVHAAR